MHRRAVMLEVLRVHAGLERSWNWNEGVDTGKRVANDVRNEEAGAFQCSCDSLRFGASKENHPFAIEYDARLLRHTLAHHGPVKRKEVHRWLRRDAVAEFESLLVERATLSTLTGVGLHNSRAAATVGSHRIQQATRSAECK